MTQRLHPPQTDVEVDVRALLRSLLRALPVLLVLMVLVAGGVFYLLARMPPVYKSEVTLLIETGESDLTRPATGTPEAQGPLDEQAIASQVQLIKSRDLARRVADKLKLADTPEYQAAISGKSFLTDDGTLTKDVMPDYLHLSLKGYQIWADAIEPTVWKLLDEPKK